MVPPRLCSVSAPGSARHHEVRSASYRGAQKFIQQPKKYVKYTCNNIHKNNTLNKYRSNQYRFCKLQQFLVQIVFSSVLFRKNMYNIICKGSKCAIIPLAWKISIKVSAIFYFLVKKILKDIGDCGSSKIFVNGYESYTQCPRAK